MKKRYEVTAEVWLYPGAVAPWHFVTIPKKESADIKKHFGARVRGFGSLPVTATIGRTSWMTSIFPDGREGAYILPLKSSVRKTESVMRGEKITVTIVLGVAVRHIV